MPNPSTADWRKIEAALERIVRGWGFELDQHSDSGDIITANAIRFNNGLNLTELAKALAEELAP